MTYKPKKPKIGGKARKPNTPPAGEPGTKAKPAPGKSPEDAGGKRPRTEKGQFPPGVSGNPQGRPLGSKNRAGRILEDMLDTHGAELATAFVTACINGKIEALKAFAALVLPAARTRYRDGFDIGTLTDIDSCIVAQRRVALAVASGDLADDAAVAIEGRILAIAKLHERSEIADRLERIEARLKAAEAQGGTHAPH